MTSAYPDDALGNWSARPSHRGWLAARADELFDLFGESALNPRGGFYELDPTGAPANGRECRQADPPDDSHGPLLHDCVVAPALLKSSIRQ